MATTRARLSSEAWAAAALEAFGEGGLAAVAVQPIAARLGVTKGSFYWHFSSREELVGAALALWEERSTEARITSLELEADPAARLRLLCRVVSDLVGQDAIEINVRAASDNELVATVLRRVEQRRLDYTIGLFEQIGFSRSEAVQRGIFSYTAYVGHGTTAARLAGILPIAEAGGVHAYADAVADLLLSHSPERAGS